MKRYGLTTWSILSRLFLYLWCAFSIFVFLWVINSSLKTNREFFSDIWGFFSSAQWANYGKVWNTYHLGIYFRNSVFTVIPAILGLLAVSAPAAYVLARFEFPLKKKPDTPYLLRNGDSLSASPGAPVLPSL